MDDVGVAAAGMQKEKRKEYFLVHREFNPRPSDHQARELFRGSVVSRGSLTKFHRGKKYPREKKLRRKKIIGII